VNSNPRRVPALLVSLSVITFALVLGAGACSRRVGFSFCSVSVTAVLGPRALAEIAILPSETGGPRLRLIAFSGASLNLLYPAIDWWEFAGILLNVFSRSSSQIH
jgi:hypothetical protein